MPDLSTQQLKELFDQYGADLFALCYLQAGRPAQALDLMAAALGVSRLLVRTPGEGTPFAMARWLTEMPPVSAPYLGLALD